MRHRVRFGRLWVDALAFDDAIGAVRALIRRGDGGAIFTPNVDHVVLADSDERFRRAYRRASLSFADGVPLVWTSRLLGKKIPEKLSGSDMLLPIVQLAAEQHWSVYLLGGQPTAAAIAASRLQEMCGVHVVGVDESFVSADGSHANDRAVIERIKAAKPDVLFVALGTPKQELFIARWLHELKPTVCIGVGATLDFISGHQSRAPRWVSNAGLEWAYRLVRDPRRLWRRYLIRGPRFIGILWRTARLLRAQRVRTMTRHHLLKAHP